MSICGKCIHYEICDEYVSPCETFPEIENGCPCYKSKDDFVEVKRGEWKKCYEGFHDIVEIICSTCGRTGAKHFRYCPNCGAKMDGERREEE